MNRAVIFILIIACLTRFAFLDARPMDHDESVHAWIALKGVLQNKDYLYNPAFHGPFLYFSTALSFQLLGDSDFTARLPTALFSVIGVLSAFSLRRWIGNSAYILTLFMLFSPSLLYYSRYARNDLIVLSSFITALYFYLRYREERRMRYVIVTAFFLAVIFTSKENWVEYIPTFLLFIPLYGIYKDGGSYVRRALNAKNVAVLAVSAIVFTLFAAFLYSSAFVHVFSGDKNPVDALFSKEWVERYINVSLSYWISSAVSLTGEQKPHFHPVWFYTLLLLKYEFLALAIAIAGIPYLWMKRKNLSFVQAFSVWWVFTALVFYHVMSYKTPWLVVHIATPLALFGSIFAGKELFNLDKEVFRVAFIFAAIVTLLVSLHVTYIDYNNAGGEELIYVQTQPQAVEMAEKISTLIHDGKRVAVYAPGHHYWPLPWILRNESVVYFAEKCPAGFDYVFSVKKDECVEAGYKAMRSYEFRVGYYFWEMVKVG
jgi:uncharacterized protein (TIGR03663 family)